MNDTTERCIDWPAVEAADAWIDSASDAKYRDQPLAQDWARVAKLAEEAGEAVNALIGCTGQNPRKGHYADTDDLLCELADVAWTAILAIQHFTKDTEGTRDYLLFRLDRIRERMPAVPAAPAGPGTTGGDPT